MKATLRHIPSLLLVVILLLSSCGNEGRKVIPRSKLAKIYAEMLLTDQWIQDTPDIRSIADTSLIYEPILEKYGYDSDDYQYTVEHYMADPERFSRILRSTVAILDKDLKALRKKQAEILRNEKLKKEIEKFEITMFQFYDEFVTEDGLRNLSDSIDVVWDTTYNAHKIIRVPRTDTIYEGPRMIVRDTIAVNDSLAVADSIAVADSLALRDSMPKVKHVVSDSLIRKIQKQHQLVRPQRPVSKKEN
jgi:hypothetical protein